MDLICRHLPVLHRSDREDGGVLVIVDQEAADIGPLNREKCVVITAGAEFFASRIDHVIESRNDIIFEVFRQDELVCFGWFDWLEVAADPIRFESEQMICGSGHGGSLPFQYT